MEQEHNRIIICRSCGADYSADLPDCPYCGTMNLPASEAAYMKKLEHVRTNLEGLGELAGQETKKGLRAMRKKLLAAALLLLLAVGLLYGAHLYRERAEARAEKEEYLWQREAFARMDACYEAGDYDALLALFYEAQDAEHHVWQYQHREFCQFLMYLDAARQALRDCETGGDPAWLLQQELWLYRLEYMRELSEDERTVLDGLRAPLLADLEARFHLTEEELADFRRILARDEYLSYTMCQEFLEERGREA